MKKCENVLFLDLLNRLNAFKRCEISRQCEGRIFPVESKAGKSGGNM